PDTILRNGLNNRYRVLEVNVIQRNGSDPEKRLTITSSQSLEDTELCILRNGWESVPVVPGDIIHLEGECSSGTWIINDQSGYLVLYPDLLLSGTTISNSIRCMRRAVLSERFRVSVNPRASSVSVGYCFTETSSLVLLKLAEILISVSLMCMALFFRYHLNLKQTEIMQEVEEYLPSFFKWVEDFM
ncbi:DNA2 nuclease, partial [Grus americana]|nr:DNA2 nuclease [Grus americana]